MGLGGKQLDKTCVTENVAFKMRLQDEWELARKEMGLGEQSSQEAACTDALWAAVAFGDLQGASMAEIQCVYMGQHTFWVYVYRVGEHVVMIKDEGRKT